MKRYVHEQFGSEVLSIAHGFSDISSYLREQDRGPIRDLVKFLLSEKASLPELYLGIDTIYPEVKEYKQIDLLAVYGDIRSKGRTIQRFQDNTVVRAFTSKFLHVPLVEIGRTQYLVSGNLDKGRELLIDGDEIFTLEPATDSPSSGYIIVASRVQLCLSTLPEFRRNYKESKK